MKGKVVRDWVRLWKSRECCTEVYMVSSYSRSIIEEEEEGESHMVGLDFDLLISQHAQQPGGTLSEPEAARCLPILLVLPAMDSCTQGTFSPFHGTKFEHSDDGASPYRPRSCKILHALQCLNTRYTQ